MSTGDPLHHPAQEGVAQHVIEERYGLEAREPHEDRVGEEQGVAIGLQSFHQPRTLRPMDHRRPSSARAPLPRTQ